MVQSLIPTSPFLGGLNTELNSLVDSTNFTKDELNVTIRANGTRARRFGVDYEELYKFNNEFIDTTLPDLAFNVIEWTDINSPDETTTYNTPYIVCQVGGTLIFFRNHGAPFSQDQASFTLDLQPYALDPNSTDYLTTRVSIAAAYGCLFITSSAIRPFYLRTAQEEEAVWAPDRLPRTQVNCTVLTTKKVRVYGGYFQVYIDGILVLTLHSDPDPYDYLKTSTQLAAAFNALPTERRRGITAEPRYPDAYPTHDGYRTTSGIIHEGVGWGNTDWITFIAPEGSGESLNGTLMKVTVTGWEKYGSSYSYDTYTYTGVMAGGIVYENEAGLTLKIRDTVGVNDYLAVDASPAKISYAHLYNLLNQGWTIDLIKDFYNAQTPKAFPANNLAQFYLKDSKTEKFKPTTLLNRTFGNTPAPKGHFRLDFFNQDRVYESNLPAAMQQLAAALGVTVEEILDENIPDWDSISAQVPVVKPRKPYAVDLCAYAGRIFYLCGDVLLYSQILQEDLDKAGQCFTEADPTSEEISDIVETDGGYISLPEIGEGVKLAAVGSYLFVFGTRGVFVISGTANNQFTATAYQAGSVSAIPTQSPNSFVETEFGVFYWGTTGVVLLSAGESGLQVQDVSTEKILTYFGKLNNLQHKYCKGSYSSARKRIYWFYPKDPEAPRKLDRVLVYDIMKQAFMVFEIGEPAGENLRQSPEIVSGFPLKVPYLSYKTYPIYTAVSPIDDTVEVNTYSYLLGETEVFSKEPFTKYYSDLLCTQEQGDFEELLNPSIIPTVREDISLDKLVHSQVHNGVLYVVSDEGTAGATLRSSTDFGQTFTTIKALSGWPNRANIGFSKAASREGSLFFADTTQAYFENGDITYPLTSTVVLARTFDNTEDCLEMPVLEQGVCHDPDFLTPPETREYSLDTQYKSDFGSRSTWEAPFTIGTDSLGGWGYSESRTLWSSCSQPPPNADTVSYRRIYFGDKMYAIADNSTVLYETSDGNTWAESTLAAPPFVSRADTGTAYDCGNILQGSTQYHYEAFVETSTRTVEVYRTKGDKWDLVMSFESGSYGFRDFTVISPDKILASSAIPDPAYPSVVFTRAPITEPAKIFKKYGTWLRQTPGALHRAVEVPYTLSSGMSLSMYVDPDHLSQYPVGTAVGPENEHVFSDVDFSKLLSQTGIVSYTTPRLTPENKTSQTLTVYEVMYTGYLSGDFEVVDDEGFMVLADIPEDTEEWSFESSLLLCLDPANGRVTFGDFHSNYKKDWVTGDLVGSGYTFDSYLVSHPVNAQDFIRNKTMPYLISYFKRTETGKDLTGNYIYGSNCLGSVLWDWRVDGTHTKWDSPQELYRPNPRTILSEGYIITKSNIRGIGRAFQVKLQSVEDKDFIVEALCFNLQGDSRI